MKLTLRLLLVGLALLAVWLLFDLAYVRRWLPETSIFWQPAGWVLLLAMPVSFYATIRRAQRSARGVDRWKAMAWTVIATLLWGYVAWTAYINFHFAIGGRL